MAIRSCHLIISSNILISLRKLMIFSTSQSIPSSVLMSPGILCFFLLFLHCEQSCRQVLLLASGFHILHFCMLVAYYFSISNVKKYYCGLLCVVRRDFFFRFHSPYVFLSHSRLLCCLPWGLLCLIYLFYLLLFFHISLYFSVGFIGISFSS